MSALVLPLDRDHQTSTPDGITLVRHCRDVLTAVLRPGQSAVLQVHAGAGASSRCCPAALRALDELLCNTVEHGFHLRLCGSVSVHASIPSARGLLLSVSDDGWGFGAEPVVDGNGFYLLRMLGQLAIGTNGSGRTAVSILLERGPRLLAFRNSRRGPPL